MHLWGTTATPSPTPTVDPELVTPGPWGFLVIALLAVAVVALMWDMQRRIRRARYREEVAAELDQLEAGRDAGESSDEPEPEPEPDGDGSGRRDQPL